MNRVGLNFFLVIYGLVFLALITPLGVLFFAVFGKLAFFIALSTLAGAILAIFMQKQESIQGNKMIDFIILLPILAAMIIWRLLWLKLNNREFEIGFSTAEIVLFLGILGIIFIVIMLDRYRKKIE